MADHSSLLSENSQREKAAQETTGEKQAVLTSWEQALEGGLNKIKSLKSESTLSTNLAPPK
jgi:hypothetical protein